METIAPTTRVKGFFNGNKYDLNLNSSKLGINTTLGSGKFLKDRHGNLINDPRLEEYVVPGNLSKEMSDEPVPINALATPVTPAADAPAAKASNPFSIRAEYRTTVTPKAAQNQSKMPVPDPQTPPSDVLERVAKEAQASVVGAGSVKAYTTEAAKRGGVIPGGVPRQKELADKLRKQLAEAKAQAAQSSEPAVQIPSAALAEPQLDEVPAPPVLETLPEQPAPQVDPAAITPRFFCAKDRMGFMYRSELKKYVKRKYPDQLKELVDDPYPLPAQAQKTEPAPVV